MQRYHAAHNCSWPMPDGEFVRYDDAQAEIARLTAERDAALAQAATAAMEMRERAAEHAWNKRDLLADAEKKQIDAGLTGRDYYGRRLEAELLSRSIRALPIDPDAQKALDEMLAKAREQGDYYEGLQEGYRAGIKEAADACRLSPQEIAEGDWGEEGVAMSNTIRGNILALLTDGGRDE